MAYHMCIVSITVSEGLHCVVAGADAGDMDEEEEEQVNEDECTVDEALKEKAAMALRAVTSELTQSSRIKGDLAHSRPVGGVNGAVCSSLMVSLTRIQQSFVL